MSFGVYIHWPFCRSKCPYCDFYSKVQKNVPQNEIIQTYLEDISYYAERTGKQNITSVFFGGGTPSLIDACNIEKIINHIAKVHKLSADAEISLEANPNTNKPYLFTDLKSAGINRLSLGIQSLNPNDLRFLGRTHSVAEALKSAEEVISVFNNHSADIIYARPEQTISKWQNELQELCLLGFKHLSLYQLTIEDGTVFARKNIKASDEETASKLYELSNEVISSYGYHRYEVSNYSQTGFECSHNKLYWQGDDYVGIGNGAHGRLHYGKQIIATTHHRQEEIITPIERAEELIIMGMRLTQGINKAKFEQCCGIAFNEYINPQTINYLQNSDLITNNSDYLAATTKGFLVLNKIIEELIYNSPIAINN